MVVNNKLLIINQFFQNVRRFHCSKIRRSYEGRGKSTMNIINVDGPKLFITSYTPVGFTLNGTSLLIGPLAIFPQTFLCWNIACGKDINEASLSLFTTIEPKLDILILGTESKYDFKIINEMRKIVSANNINVEVLPVDQACGTYNFLCDEGRHVAAGLIPPLPTETFTYKKIASTIKSIGEKE